jgi:hypothetical protein
MIDCIDASMLTHKKAISVSLRIAYSIAEIMRGSRPRHPACLEITGSI